MTKIKKNLILQHLKHSVLRSINESCLKRLDESVETMSDAAEIMHNDETIGEVRYVVLNRVLACSFAGSYDYAPHGFESDLILESAHVTAIYNQKGVPMANLTERLNQMLAADEGQILNHV